MYKDQILGKFLNFIYLLCIVSPVDHPHLEIPPHSTRSQQCLTESASHTLIGGINGIIHFRLDFFFSNILTFTSSSDQGATHPLQIKGREKKKSKKTMAL